MVVERPSMMQSNEPLVIQALEEAILYYLNHYGDDVSCPTCKAENSFRIREFRKLLQRAQAKTIERTRNRRQKIQKRDRKR